MNLKTIHLFPFVCHSNTHGKNKSTLVSSKNVRGTGGCYRRVARIFRWGGGCVLKMNGYKLVGGRGPGACSPGNILETLKCLGLHFTRFHGGEREKENVE